MNIMKLGNDSERVELEAVTTESFISGVWWSYMGKKMLSLKMMPALLRIMDSKPMKLLILETCFCALSFYILSEKLYSGTYYEQIFCLWKLLF